MNLSGSVRMAKGGEMGMSVLGNNGEDDVLFEIEKFLKDHTISELLEIVKYACEEKEEGYLN